MKTKLEIIKETVAAYSNPANRAVTNTRGMTLSACHYLHPDGSGRMCAFGRCMEAPDPDDGRWVRNMGTEEMNDELKPEYRGHDREFWIHLQKFHDTDAHFTDDGISPLGVEYIKKMKKAWA